MQLQTHLQTETSLCGKVVNTKEGYAEVVLHTTQQMGVDAKGLVHGGFVFGAADLAAMAAVNDPFVVLGAATSKFLAPVKVHDVVVCKAKVVEQKGEKHLVESVAYVDDKEVFWALFTTFVLEQHVLDKS